MEGGRWKVVDGVGGVDWVRCEGARWASEERVDGRVVGRGEKTMEWWLALGGEGRGRLITTGAASCEDARSTWARPG